MRQEQVAERLMVSIQLAVGGDQQQVRLFAAQLLRVILPGEVMESKGVGVGCQCRIEADAGEQLSLADLARETSMSPYHFLRTFRRLIGVTPHQYVLRTRLHRAAVRLRQSGDAISAIAFDVGFNDLSTFNRRFRRVMGVHPGAYLLARRAS